MLIKTLKTCAGSLHCFRDGSVAAGRSVVAGTLKAAAQQMRWNGLLPVHLIYWPRLGLP